MKKATLFLFLLGLFGIPLSQNAQAQFGPFVEKGFGVAGGFSKANNSTTFGGTAGYVVLDPLELGLDVRQANSDQNDFSRSGVGPYLAVYPLAQAGQIPLSVSLSGSYSFDSFSGGGTDQFESRGGDLSGNTMNFGGSIFRVIEVGKLVEVIPAAGVTYAEVKTEATAQGETQTNTEETTSFGASVSFSFEASEAVKIVATPSASFSDDNTAFGLSASLVVPQ